MYIITRQNKTGSASGLRDFDVLSLIEQMTIRCMNDVSVSIRNVEREIQLPPHLFDMLNKLELSCRRLVSRINGLVEIFGRDGRGGRLSIASYDLNQFFSTLVEQINIGLSDKTGGIVKFSLHKDTSESASFDARRVCTILYHLIANAIEHGGTDNKNINIKCRVSNNILEIAVQDHGNGISESAAELLHGEREPEFHLESQNIGAFPPYIGGMGFAVCKKLAADMNGKIDFKNYITGARFTLKIPQKTNRVHLTRDFRPDNRLFSICMTPVFMLYNKEDKK